MGATGWTYYTPYISDAGAALERLRQETFRAGAYKKPGGDHRKGLEMLLQYHSARNNQDGVEAARMAMNMLDAVESGSDALLTPEELRSLNQARALKAAGGYIPWLKRKRTRSWSTIEELLDDAAENGTHSVLDITQVASRRQYGAAAPLSKRELKTAFGTETPTRADLETGDWSFEEGLERWQAAYFVVYENGRPSEYCFVGCSGD